MGGHSEGAQFVNWFGPLLDALRHLGGSGTPDEVTEQIAVAQSVSDDVQNELTSSGQPRFKNLELGLRPVTTYEIDEAFFAEFTAR
jgi:restriction system protein